MAFIFTGLFFLLLLLFFYFYFFILLTFGVYVKYVQRCDYSRAVHLRTRRDLHGKHASVSFMQRVTCNSESQKSYDLRQQPSTVESEASHCRARFYIVRSDETYCRGNTAATRYIYVFVAVFFKHRNFCVHDGQTPYAHNVVGCYDATSSRPLSLDNVYTDRCFHFLFICPCVCTRRRFHDKGADF